MKYFFYYVIIPLLLGIISIVINPKRAQWNPPSPSQDEIVLADIKRIENSVLWVDSRPNAQFAQDHIPDAISLNDENFEHNLPILLEKWQPGCSIVIYCDSAMCDASHAMADRLRHEVGLPDVWILFGGWNAWKKLNEQ